MPMGAWGSENSPRWSATVCNAKSESFACNVICAPGMGRCCASWTRPRTVANTVAQATTLEHNKTRIRLDRRCMKGRPPRKRETRRDASRLMLRSSQREIECGLNGVYETGPRHEAQAIEGGPRPA